jgi:hypothetical protein
VKRALLLPAVCLASAFAAYAALGTEPPRSPAASIEAGAQALRKNDVRSFLKLTLSDAGLAEMKADWDLQRAKKPSAEEEAAFAATMEKLTAEGAEDALMAELSPKLDEMRPQVAMMIGMFNGMADAALAQNTELSDEEREQGREVLKALADLLGKNDLTDPKLARRAIDVVCGTARALGIASFDQLRGLSFEELLSRADLVFAGAKDLLAIYGLSVDAWLDSVKAETLAEEGDHATVRIRFEILGTSHSVDTEMVKTDGRWIKKELEGDATTIGGQRRQ